MRQHSKEAWGIASRYSAVLASETRDLAAAIDATLNAEREACAVIARNWKDDGAGTAWEKCADIAADEIADAILARSKTE